MRNSWVGPQNDELELVPTEPSGSERLTVAKLAKGVHERFTEAEVAQGVHECLTVAKVALGSPLRSCRSPCKKETNYYSLR